MKGYDVHEALYPNVEFVNPVPASGWGQENKKTNVLLLYTLMKVFVHTDYVNTKVIVQNQISPSEKRGLHYTQVTDKGSWPLVYNN